MFKKKQSLFSYSSGKLPRKQIGWQANSVVNPNREYAVDAYIIDIYCSAVITTYL